MLATVAAQGITFLTAYKNCGLQMLLFKKKLVTATLCWEFMELIRWCYFIGTLCPNNSQLFLREHWLMSPVTLHDEEDWGRLSPPNHRQSRHVQGTCFFLWAALLGAWFRFHHDFPEFNNCHLPALASHCSRDWLTGRYLWLSCALQHWAFLIMGLSSG